MAGQRSPDVIRKSHDVVPMLHPLPFPVSLLATHSLFELERKASYTENELPTAIREEGDQSKTIVFSWYVNFIIVN